jgi:hypothetical protein
MATVVGLKTEVVHRYVFELRFEFGHVYWDRAGRIAKEILGIEGWDFEQIDMNHCHLARRDRNLNVNFGPGKLDLSQTQGPDVAELMPPGEFGATAEELATIVVKHLEVDTFPRIGFRVWHLYPSADREESQHLVQSLRMFSTDSQIQERLGPVSEVSHRLVVERPAHMLRIAVAPFEQAVELPPSVVRAAKPKTRDLRHNRKGFLDKLKAERIIRNYPQFGLLVDLDAYVEDPPYPDDLAASDFITNAIQDFETIKPLLLEGPS